MNEDEKIQLAQHERGQRLLHEAEEQAEAEQYYEEQRKAYIAELEAENERLRGVCVEFEHHASEERIQQSNRNAEHHEKTMKQAIKWKRDAERFNALQNMEPKKAQTFFWNYTSRKQRAKAIDDARTTKKA